MLGEWDCWHHHRARSWATGVETREGLRWPQAGTGRSSHYWELAVLSKRTLMMLRRQAKGGHRCWPQGATCGRMVAAVARTRRSDIWERMVRMMKPGAPTW